MTNGELSVFLLTYMSPNTNVILIVPKQNWFHFEALEFIFHLNLKKFPPSISWLTINKIQRFQTYGLDPVKEISNLIYCKALGFSRPVPMHLSGWMLARTINYRLCFRALPICSVLSIQENSKINSQEIKLVSFW